MPRTLLLIVLALPSAALGQGVLPLSGSYRIGGIATSFGQPPCTPTTVPSCGATVGTATLQPNGSFTVSSSSLDICPGGLASSGSANGGGTYTVDTRGQLVLDFDPTNPGDDTATYLLRADGSVAVEGRTETGPASFLSIAVRLSSGQGNGSLSGAYHVARLAQFNGASSFALRAELGLITFDGAGSYSEAGMRHAVVAGGTATSTAYAANGSYAVATDGTITAPAIDGAVAADGEVFFWVRRAAPQSEVELVVGVRRGASYPPSLFRGDWGLALMESELSSGNEQLDTDFGVVTATPLTPTGGELVGTLFNVQTTPFSSGASLDPVAAPYTLGSDGTLVLAPPAPPGVPAAVGAAGTFFVGICTFPEGAGLLLGVLRCPWPRAFGIATPGSGGISPRTVPDGGFPLLGNGGFGVKIESGLGGAPALMLLAGGTSPGIKFLGTTIWLDPSVLISTPLVLSGTPGQPGAGVGAVALPVPLVTELDGVALALQGFVADSGAPKGLSATPALVVEFCR